MYIFSKYKYLQTGGDEISLDRTHISNTRYFALEDTSKHGLTNCYVQFP